MKPLLLLGLILLPVFGFSQVEDSVKVVRALDSLVQVCRTMTGQGKYEDALQIIDVAKKKAVEFFGMESAGYAGCVFNQGRVFYAMGNYTMAEPLYLEAKAIREKVLGSEHPDYAQSLNNLGLLYEAIGNYAKTEQLWLNALSIRQKVLGKEHAHYAQSLNNLGVLYSNMGNYSKAEPFYIEALSIYGQLFGKENSDYALSLNNLGSLYSNMGNYVKAELFFLEALKTQEKTLGKENADYALSLANLGAIYHLMGNYIKAKAYYFESLTINEKILGKEHPDYLSSLDNMSMIYRALGDYSKAESYCLQALKICEKSPGKEHQYYASILTNLGMLYFMMEKYEIANALFMESLTLREKILGRTHPHYIWNLNNLGNLHAQLGNYNEAENYLQEALKIHENTIGKIHPNYALMLDNLLKIYNAEGDYERIAYYSDELANVDQFLLLNSSTHLSDNELINYIHTFSERVDHLLSITKNSNSQLPKIAQIAYSNTLFSKGFLLNNTIHLNNLVNRDSVTLEQYQVLQSYQRSIGKEYNKPIKDRDSTHLAQLVVNANTLEKELIRTVTGYGEALSQVSWSQLRDILLQDEASIEFVHFRYFDRMSKPTDSTIYAALIILPGATAPKFIPLFEERELNTLLKGASGKAFSRINTLYSAPTQFQGQKSLYDLVWKPLEKELQGVKTVYCSPSGLLHKINLGAISFETGTISDRYQVVVLSSTRKLVIPDQNAHVGNEAQLFGGIRYTMDSTLVATVHFESDRSRGLVSDALPFRTDSTTRSDSWNYLPETAAEVRDIQQVFQSKNWTSQLDTGYLATEEAFRSLGKDKHSPRVLHIATHGFFFPDPKTTQDNRQRMMDGSEPVFRLSEHPMIRSGLILAGAQEAWSSGKPPENREDGILTAYEISQMNLSNTELVVLSACETGLGDIQGNEGVYGLQRAFKIAGAKYLIMSLWKVSDQSSREMMTEFYQCWLGEGLTIPEAFRKAQGNMKRKYPDAPYHWAGFVLVE